MKKIIVLLATFVAVLITNLHAGNLLVSNLDDGQFVAPVAIKGNANVAQTASKDVALAAFNAGAKEEGVRIASLVPSTSSALNQSRAYAMAGAAGRVVPTDRMNNPPAWYLVPEDGLQLYDMLTTSFHSWLGTTYNTNAATSAQFGHRIVVHVAGKYPVSNYWCRLTSSIAGLSSAFFPVGTNTSNGAEIAFNANFVGINFGQNGTLDSSVNPITGVWTQGGDDTVYSNGELPSQVNYTWWYRFGSTSSINLSDVNGFNPLKAEFVWTNKFFKAELVIPGEGETVVATSTVTAALPRLVPLGTDSQGLILTIQGGQTILPYRIETRLGYDDMSEPWVMVSNQDYYTGSIWKQPTIDPHRFYRLKALPNP